ncbi:hypothetical protein ABIA30_005058 [Mycobacterium sp. MAA66]|uniref:hypothetical protein n=1 Tax=Mycobacterium sp. MAA66 TaxID=3156297 RepID=UPI003512FD6E
MRCRARFGAGVAIVLGGCAAAHFSDFSPVNTAAAQPQLTPCASVPIDYQRPLQDQHIHCGLIVNDHVAIDVSSDPAWSMQVRTDGTPTQQFTEPTTQAGESGEAPVLADIDHSGVPVLLVITDRGGSGGEPMAVWKMSGPPTHFVRAGELFGFQQFYRTPEGLFGNYAHSSADSGDVTLYRWDADRLAKVVDLEVQASGSRADVSSEPAGPWVHNGNTDCRAQGDDAVMRTAGIDPATASQQLCTQAWVGSIYQQH